MRFAIGIGARILLSGNALLAQAVDVGVVGGIRTTGDFTGTGSSESKRYIVGPAVNIRLPKHLSAEVDALFQRSGYTAYEPAGESFENVRERTNSWQFPVILKYRLPVRLAHPFVGIGYAPRIVNGTDVWWGESAGCFCYVNGRSPAIYPVIQGLVVSGGVSFGTGHFLFTPEVRHTHWNAPYLGSYFVASNEVSVLLGIRWH
jgi:hypothetical protein